MSNLERLLILQRSPDQPPHAKPEAQAATNRALPRVVLLHVLSPLLAQCQPFDGELGIGVVEKLNGEIIRS